MKALLLLAILTTVMLSSCSTLANRRDLFGPSKPQGEYLEKHRKMMYHPRASHGVPN